jgi:hypothetical protein
LAVLELNSLKSLSVNHIHARRRNIFLICASKQIIKQEQDKMAQSQRIMIIRHAEKPYDDGKENNLGVRMDGSSSVESLAVRGWQRAGALALLFGSAALAQSRGLSVPQHLYASDPDKADKIGSKSRRPKQTLIPLAQRLDFQINASW